jgi:hypothetical protein
LGSRLTQPKNLSRSTSGKTRMKINLVHLNAVHKRCKFQQCIEI